MTKARYYAPCAPASAGLSHYSAIHFGFAAIAAFPLLTQAVTESTDATRLALPHLPKIFVLHAIAFRTHIFLPVQWLDFRVRKRPFSSSRCPGLSYYIIPIPPAGAPAAGVSSLISATTDSVVSNVEATLVAFCSALLVTLAGSMIPDLIMST